MTGGGGTWRGVVNVPPPLVPSPPPPNRRSERSPAVPSTLGHGSLLQRSCIRQLSDQASDTAVLKEEEGQGKPQSRRAGSLGPRLAAAGNRRERSSIRLFRWVMHQCFTVSNVQLESLVFLLRSPDALSHMVPALRALPPLTQAIMLSSSEMREIKSSGADGRNKRGSKRGKMIPTIGMQGRRGRAETDDISLSAPLLMCPRVGIVLTVIR